MRISPPPTIFHPLLFSAERKCINWSSVSFISCLAVHLVELASPKIMFWQGDGAQHPADRAPLLREAWWKNVSPLPFILRLKPQWRKRNLPFPVDLSVSRPLAVRAIPSVNEEAESTGIQPVVASSLDYPHKTFPVGDETRRWGGVDAQTGHSRNFYPPGKDSPGVTQAMVAARCVLESIFISSL